jgi:magnesium and cobalt transporter
VNDAVVAWLLAAAAAIAAILHFGLSIALASATRVSRVALQRMGNEFGEKLAFVRRLAEPTSRHRLAASLGRQFSLLAFVLFGGLLVAGVGVAAPWRWTIAATAVVAVLVAEHALARGLAEWNPRLALRATAWMIRVARFVLLPFVALLSGWLSWCDGNGRTEEEREEEQEEEVEALIEVGEREGLLEASESRMVRGIVDLDETVVRELMTPRTEIVALDVSTSVRDARRLFLASGHSRLPAFRASIENIVGLLHARDLFRAWEAGDDDVSIEGFVRPVPFVPESLSAAELLAEMRKSTRLAVVVDEYGGVAGLVTFEDLLEKIVGEIRDEHAEHETSMHADIDGSWIVNSDVHAKEIEQLFDIHFDDRDFDTVGGMVVSAFGRVPEVGDTLLAHGLAVEVLQADRTRVRQVRLARQSDVGERAG